MTRMVSLVKGTTIETSRNGHQQQINLFLDNIYFAYYGKKFNLRLKCYHTVNFPLGQNPISVTAGKHISVPSLVVGTHLWRESVKGYNCLNTVWNIICTHQISKHIKYTGVFH